MDGVIGCLGAIVFEVSESVARTLSNMKWSGAARYAVHQRHVGFDLTEFVGVENDKFTFTMTLLADWGVDPMEEVKKLWNYERSGKAVPLTIGEHAYGFYRWNVVSHSLSVQYTDVHGNLYAADVSVTLQAYYRPDRPSVDL